MAKKKSDSRSKAQIPASPPEDLPQARVVDLSTAKARARVLKILQPPGDNSDRRLYRGDTCCEYVLSPIEDLEQRHARVVTGCNWQDLRTTAASQLPPPGSEIFNVWEVVRAAAKPLYLTSRYLGIAYQTADGREILANAVATETFALNALVLACAAAPPPPPPPCPTFSPISGSGRAWSAYRTSAKAAENAAIALVPGRASTDAGLEANAFTCPNPACVSKAVVGLTSTVTDSGASVSLIASFFYLEWRYGGYADYSWSAFVNCV
jgi:hypothetical protein